MPERVGGQSTATYLQPNIHPEIFPAGYSEQGTDCDGIKTVLSPLLHGPWISQQLPNLIVSPKLAPRRS